MSYEVPILLTTFLRYNEVVELIKILSILKPKILFLTSDGPRSESERILVVRVRSYLESIPWNCEVHRLYSDLNQGIHKNVRYALDYAFERVDKLIFIEDDVIPSLFFFEFTKTLLERYNDSLDVKMINGHNFAPHIETNRAGYFFSKRISSSCNAYWKRTYIETLKIQSNLDEYNANFNYDSIENKNFRHHFRNIVKKQLRSDYYSIEGLFIMSIMFNDGLTIVSDVNLVELRGNDEYSTNSPSSDYYLPSKLQTLYNIPSLDHTSLHSGIDIIYNQAYDEYLSKLYGEGRIYTQLNYGVKSVLRYLIKFQFRLLLKKLKKRTFRIISRGFNSSD